MFTTEDLQWFGTGENEYPRIFADGKDLVESPTEWQKRGLQQTATGYGGKLNTGRKISYCGKLYRLYATCYSNAASVWFTCQGKKIYVS